MGSRSVQTEVLFEDYDISTVDGVIGALYDVISFERGDDQDWDKFRKLFIEEAQLIQVSGSDYSTMSVEDYISNFKENRTSGSILAFQEEELHREVDQFGPMAQVYSTYKTTFQLADGPSEARGINSIQLLQKEDRWWIVNIVWTGETDQTNIPDQYLSGSN
jgi:hypothetical protein